ncbi:unnamed protein product, partial [Schistosoma haematobium]
MTCNHSFLKIVLHLVFNNYSTIKSVSDVNYKFEILHKSFAANNNNTYTNSNTTKCPGMAKSEIEPTIYLKVLESLT